MNHLSNWAPHSSSWCGVYWCVVTVESAECWVFVVVVVKAEVVVFVCWHIDGSSSSLSKSHVTHMCCSDVSPTCQHATTSTTTTNTYHGHFTTPTPCQDSKQVEPRGVICILGAGEVFFPSSFHFILLTVIFFSFTNSTMRHQKYIGQE